MHVRKVPQQDEWRCFPDLHCLPALQFVLGLALNGVDQKDVEPSHNELVDESIRHRHVPQQAKCSLQPCDRPCDRPCDWV